jgi:hypothetical protein
MKSVSYPVLDHLACTDTACTDVAKDTSLTSSDKRGLREQFKDFRVYFGCWKHAKALIGTAGCWFLLYV